MYLKIFNKTPVFTTIRKSEFTTSGRKQKSAFTLAEVLITLGIIGIVAAMTLPTVINNSRNKQLEAGLKRAYSLISQALDRYQAETGERITTDTGASQKIKPLIIKYLQIAQDCGYGSKDSKACIQNWDNATDERQSTKYKNFNGKTVMNVALFDDGQFVLNDGSLVLLENQLNNKKLYISVDVNGYNKNPNRLGVDLFMFQIDDKGKLLPMGVSGTDYYTENEEYCSVTSTNNMNGAGCSYKALTDKNYFKNLPR